MNYPKLLNRWMGYRRSPNFKKQMKNLLVAFLLLFAAHSFAQTQKVAVLTASLSTDDELNYEPLIRQYIEEQLKKVPNTSSAVFSSSLSGIIKSKRAIVSGTFIDDGLTKKAAADGVSILVLAYNDANIIEKKVLDPGLESTSYGCEMELTIQVVNTTSNQIINGKKFYLAMGMKFKEGENYKTKEEAAKAALNGAAFADIKKTIPANLGAFLAENVK
jgi:hypothetical protein